jgi:serine/threonine protein kinase
MTTAAPQKPTQLGSYALLELLGQGGMGDVWRAGLGAHASPSSVVALGGRSAVCVKVIKRELANNDKAVDMFLREAKLAARLHHPGIVRILELGRDNGTYFLVMEMLEGLAWHDVAQRNWRHGKTLPIEAIVRAAAEAAYALEYAHTLVGVDGKQLGMVHRDISPDNLFLTTKGPTKVLDFGIAKATSMDATRLTERGELRGKLPYMPPEQVRTDDVDGRADQWALGISLYYLTTAQRPFDRESPLDTMNAIMTLAPMSVLHMNPNIPPELAGIIERALAKRPEDRYSSAKAMGDELLSLLPAAVDDGIMLRLLRDTERLERGDRRPLSAAPSAPLWQWRKKVSVAAAFDCDPETREIGMLSTAVPSHVSFDLGTVVGSDDDQDSSDDVATTIRMPRLASPALAPDAASASPIASTLRMPRPSTPNPHPHVSAAAATLRVPMLRDTSAPSAPLMPFHDDVTMMEATPLPSAAVRSQAFSAPVVHTMADAGQSTAEALGSPSIEDFGAQLRDAIPPRALPRLASPVAAMPPPVLPSPAPSPMRAGVIAFGITALLLFIVLVIAVMRSKG